MDESVAIEEVLGGRVDEENSDEAWTDKGARELNALMGPRRYGGRSPAPISAKDDKEDHVGGNELAFAHGLSDPDADFRSPTPDEVRAARDRAAKGENPQPGSDYEKKQDAAYARLGRAIGHRSVGAVEVDKLERRAKTTDKERRAQSRAELRAKRKANPYRE